MIDFSDFTLLKQGAEARLKVGTFLGGRKAIVKERFSKKYRHPDLDAKLTKERFRGEIRSLMRAKTVGIRTPTLYWVDAETSSFAMEYLDAAPTCRDYIKANRADEGRLTALAAEMGRVIGVLHNNNLIHGDLTTSNILVEKAPGLSDDVIDDVIKLCVIDFGLGYVEGSIEDKGVDLYVLERALISTHPNTEFMFEEILRSYKTEMKNNKVRNEIVKKYEEIRMRGRKRAMLG